MSWILIVLAAIVVLMVVYDLTQRSHAILRNFPIIGHFRYWLEAIGPELRQYIVTGNDLDLSRNYLIIKHSAYPLATPHVGEEGFDPEHRLPCAKILGGARKRSKAFRPASVVNISAMSFGSLGGHAVEANPVRAIEIKLSQGAKPGLGGVLPALVSLDQFDLQDDRLDGIPAAEVLDFGAGWGLPSVGDREEIQRLMNGG